MPTLAELNRWIDGRLDGDREVEIQGVASLEAAGSADIAPLAAKEYMRAAGDSQAGAFLVLEELAETIDRPCIRHAFPLAALNVVMERLGLVSPAPQPGIHPTAVIDTTAELGKDVSCGPYVCIGPGVRIGARSILHANVVIERGVTLGEDCRIEPGAVLHEGAVLGNRVQIGAQAVISRQGFGFGPSAAGPVKLHHLGRVVLEDDVHIGAGTMVDRARFDETRIGQGSALDNLVQIGHNSIIGRYTFIASQAGLAGRSIVGNQCEIGGQAGVANGAVIGDRARIGAQAGAIASVDAGTEVWGTPARPKAEYLRQLVALRRLTK